LVNAKKQELIEELKALRIEKGYTYQQIADETELMGCPVSLSTVKLVFSDKRSHNHDYNNILRPIADVLSSPSADDTLEIKTLQTRLELKEEIIKQYQIRIENKDKKYKDRESFYMQQIEFLQNQINFKDSEIKRLTENIDRKDATIRDYLLTNDE
jgi:transcriptional regulator with XRE-family HTH domain